MLESTVIPINISMPCVDNKDLIYNVKELPETFSVSSGDLFLIETDEGTNIMDYDNLIIGLNNTTFGTTIITHSTDINALSAEVTSLKSLSAAVVESNAALSAQVVGNTTKAMISLLSGGEYGPTLVAGNNIASIEWQSSVVRFNFITNFNNTNYIVIPSAAVLFGGALTQFAVSEKSTNYVDLSALDLRDIKAAFAPASGEPIGFQIQTF
jgi:hypothetical protein|tara:strand:- start:283 stop:915 length:633 start_codon:yes stop_codon:yes gene_type:complete